MTVGKRSEISAPIFVRLLIALAVALVWTLFVAAMLNVESGHVAGIAGKGALTMLVLAAPVIFGLKVGSSVAGSYLLAFSTYFVICYLVTMYVWRGSRSH